MLLGVFWNARGHAFNLFRHTTGHSITFRIPALSLSWMNPLFLIWSVKIYKPHFILPFSIFYHIVLTSVKLKNTSALSLTLYCHFVWLINLYVFSSFCKFHYPPSTTMGVTPALATPTQLSDQTQLHVPFISAGAAWPRGSSVNLWSQSIIYSPTCPRALHCH